MPEEWITGGARVDTIAITNHEIKEARLESEQDMGECLIYFVSKTTKTSPCS